MRKLIVITFVFAFICAHTGISAQTSISLSGKLKGTVTDKTGKAIEYVSVIIHNISLSASTDENGDYSFANIQPGSYLLTFKRSGYETKSMEVNFSGKDSSLNIYLNESLIETGVIDVTGSFNAV